MGEIDDAYDCMFSNKLPYTTPPPQRVSTRSEDPFVGSGDWSPGLITRALVIGLGYVVGNRIYVSANGLGLATFLVFIIVGNEFCAFSIKCALESRRQISSTKTQE